MIISRKKLLKLPIVFIASSSENIKIAESFSKYIADISRPVLWNSGVFVPSSTNIESLIAQLETTDFGIFIFAPDDKIKVRGKNYNIARDNIIFEFGLFMGAISRERCFMVIPHKKTKFKIPSDLLGFVPLTYNFDYKAHSKNTVNKHCNEVKKIISKQGKRI